MGPTRFRLAAALSAGTLGHVAWLLCYSSSTLVLLCAVGCAAADDCGGRQEDLRQQARAAGDPPLQWTGVVSLSTVPERLADGLLEPTIRTLLRQTVLLPIVVAIPWHSKRFPEKEYLVPDWLNRTPGIEVVRCEDWGPSTKLIAALDVVREDDSVIITVDDDTLYHPQLVENLLHYAALLPHAAVAHAGHRLWGPDLDLKNFRSVEFLRPPHHARFYGRY